MFQKVTRDDLLKNKIRHSEIKYIWEMSYVPSLEIWNETEHMNVSSITSVKYLVKVFGEPRGIQDYLSPSPGTMWSTEKCGSSSFGEHSRTTGPAWPYAAAKIMGLLPWLLGPKPYLRAQATDLETAFVLFSRSFCSYQFAQGPQPCPENSARGLGLC